MLLTQICNLFHLLLLSNELLTSLLLAKKSNLSRHLFEDALSPVRELVHHLHGEFLDHLSTIRISRLSIIVAETLGHCCLRVINSIAEWSLAFLIFYSS